MLHKRLLKGMLILFITLSICGVFLLYILESIDIIIADYSTRNGDATKNIAQGKKIESSYLDNSITKLHEENVSAGGNNRYITPPSEDMRFAGRDISSK